mgnify:CR=1 FL=1
MSNSLHKSECKLTVFLKDKTKHEGYLGSIRSKKEGRKGMKDILNETSDYIDGVLEALGKNTDDVLDVEIFLTYKDPKQ